MNPVWNHRQRHAYALECLEACTGTCEQSQAVRTRFRISWVDLAADIGASAVMALYVVALLSNLTH